MTKKRIMVDMSATLLHHGHIRLLKKAAEFGDVIVGLTDDNEVFQKKGYRPELNFEERKEILESIKYVHAVVPVPWLLDEEVLVHFKIDFLIHGDDNSNIISPDKIKIFPRTKGVSSSDMRLKSLRAITNINNQKLMLTPGPASVLYENIEYLKPVFGRGDEDFTKITQEVHNWIKKLSGQDELVSMQGSATLGLELAAHCFVSGRVLLISTGFYSDRLKRLLPGSCKLTICNYEELAKINEKFDWVMCAYTETSVAFKVDLELIKNKANIFDAKLYVDATGSIGLEDNHHFADVTAFSSCKGLMGLAGASFVAFKSNLKPKKMNTFYFNLKTQKEKLTTGPYHAISSLYGVKKIHNILRDRVIKSKNAVLEKYENIVRSEKKNQPLLCTYIEGEVLPNDDNIVLYTPRSKLSGSVICHFGELHTDEIQIINRIRVK